MAIAAKLAIRLGGSECSVLWLGDAGATGGPVRSGGAGACCGGSVMASTGTPFPPL